MKQTISYDENKNFTIANDIPIENPGGALASHYHHNSSHIEQEMWDSFILTDDTFGIDKTQDELDEEARINFEQKVSGFGLWGGPEMTPFAEEAFTLKELQDEIEHDEIILEILEGLSE